MHADPNRKDICIQSRSLNAAPFLALNLRCPSCIQVCTIQSSYIQPILLFTLFLLPYMPALHIPAHFKASCPPSNYT